MFAAIAALTLLSLVTGQTNPCTYTIGTSTFALGTLDQGIDYEFTVTANVGTGTTQTFNLFGAPPCRYILPATGAANPPCTSTTIGQVVQPINGLCIEIGYAGLTSYQLLDSSNPSAGISLTYANPITDPLNAFCPNAGPNNPRAVTYNLVCDPTVPLSNPPDAATTQNPNELCQGVITWRNPAACPLGAQPSASSAPQKEKEAKNPAPSKEAPKPAPSKEAAKPAPSKEAAKPAPSKEAAKAAPSKAPEQAKAHE